MKTIAPMLAKIGDIKVLHNKKNYFFEPKYDGIRAVCYVNSSIMLLSRYGKNITHRYPELSIRPLIKAKSAILDGEIIVYDEKGVPNFNLLQSRDLIDQPFLIDIRSTTFPATYVIFDLLELNGKSVIHQPITERKKLLKKIIKQKKKVLELSPASADGQKLWKKMEKLRFEGVMAKEKKGLYYPGLRKSVWLKIKPHQTYDCIIIGFSQEKRLVSALALGLYDKGKLRFVGKVGTGLDEAEEEVLYKKLKKIVRKTAPCPCPLKNMQWVKPVLVCEIRYAQITKDKKFRIPVFLRLRNDKKPKDCTMQQ